jgi:hypothetical protein
VLDVDGWLNTIEPEIFDKWMAFKRIEPDEPARIREIIKLGFCALANAWGAKISPELLDPQMMIDRKEEPFDDVAWAQAFMAANGVDISAEQTP